MPYDPIAPVRAVRGVMGIVPNNVDVNIYARITASQGDILQFDMVQADTDTVSNDTDGKIDSGHVSGVDVSDFVGLTCGVLLADVSADAIGSCRIVGQVQANILRNAGSTDSKVGDAMVVATESSVGALDSIFATGETYRAILMEPMLRADEPKKRLVLFCGVNDGFGSFPATGADGGGSGDYSSSGGGGTNA